MAQIIRKVLVPGVSEKVVFKIVETISEALVQNAKDEFGDTFNFKTDLRINEKRGYVESFVRFWPYKYDFIWKIHRSADGVEVALDARTGGSWYDFLFDMHDKLNRLVFTQWSALLNFCMGYLTAMTYRGGGQAKEHIRSAKARMRETVTKKR
jgi:hypothetical protein